MPGCGYALQLVFAAVMEVDAGSGDEVDDGARHQYLARDTSRQVSFVRTIANVGRCPGNLHSNNNWTAQRAPSIFSVADTTECFVGSKIALDEAELILHHVIVSCREGA